jgi:hypothetical protein
MISKNLQTAYHFSLLVFKDMGAQTDGNLLARFMDNGNAICALGVTAGQTFVQKAPFLAKTGAKDIKTLVPHGFLALKAGNDLGRGIEVTNLLILPDDKNPFGDTF